MLLLNVLNCTGIFFAFAVFSTIANNLLEYPQYTKPQEWKGRAVPEVLLSGNHAKIKDWRLAQSEDITRRQRQDLWEKYHK